MLLYTPSPELGDNSLGVLADVTRRQRVRQITHEILKACTSANSPFSWARIQGFDRLAAVLEAGVAGDFAALGASLDQTYSQVLDAVLSSLDRTLVIPPDQLRPPSALGAGTGTVRSRLAQHLAHHQQALSGGAPPLPAGLAPGHAGPREWAAAMRALEGVCILHLKTRAVLATAQYLQLLVSRACSCPRCAPPALDALLAILAGSAEAQALLVGNGCLDAVVRLARGQASEPGSRRAGGGGGGGGAGTGASGGGGGGGAVAVVPRGVQLRCLGFLHVFVGHILSRAVRAGQVHLNSQRSAQQLLHSELGTAAADALLKVPAEATLAAAGGPAAGGGGGGVGSGGGGGGPAPSPLVAVTEAALAAMVSCGRVVAR